MRRGRRDDDGSAGTGAGPGGEQQDTARYGAEQPPDARPGPAYGTYGQPLFGRPAYGQPGYGNNPYPPSEAYGAPTGAAGPARGRPGLIVFIAFLVQLAIVAAIGNTWATRHAVEFRQDHGRLLGEFATVPLVFSWRPTPQDGTDAMRLYLAMVIGLAALFVVTALLSLALVRGPVTFWRALVGVGLATLAGVLVSGVVRRAIVGPFGSDDRVTLAVFRGGGTEIPAGVLLGLVTGLIAAIIAVVSRRPGVVPFAATPPAAELGPDPEAPTPWYGDDARPAPEQYGTSPSMQKVQQSVGPSAQPDSQTQAFGTERLPDVAPAPPARPAPAAPDAPRGADAQATTQFPAAGAVERRPDRPDRTDEATQAVPVTPPRSDDRPAEPRPADARPQAPAGADEPTSVRRPGGFPPPGAQSTQRFPRPPDDEELGHHPD